jgi:hypothetical protein
VEIVRRPEGESGVVVGRFTERNINEIARLFALPEPVRRKRYGSDDQLIGHLARTLGVSPAFIRRAKGDKRVRKELRDKVVESVEYLMPTIIYRQVELAMERDTKAARYAAEFVQWIKSSGVNVQTNVGVQVQMEGKSDGGIAEDSENLQKLRELRESGALDRLLGRIEPASSG